MGEKNEDEIESDDVSSETPKPESNTGRQTSGGGSDDDGIDPGQADEYKRGERYRCRDGRKLFRVVGLTRDATGNGTAFIELRLVCLKDYEQPGMEVDRETGKWVKNKDLAPPSDEGLSCRLKFHDTEKARPRIANFAREMGRTTRFSFSNDDHIEEIAFDKLFIGEVEVDVDKQGREWPECVSWERYEGEKDPAWEALFDKGVDDFEEAGKKREESARREAEKQGGGGRSRGRGGSGGGRGGSGGGRGKGYGF